MSRISVDSRFEDGDGFYAALVDALDEAGEEKAERLLARLVLILANQIGDRATLHEALELARRA